MMSHITWRDQKKLTRPPTCKATICPVPAFIFHTTTGMFLSRTLAPFLPPFPLETCLPALRNDGSIFCFFGNEFALAVYSIMIRFASNGDARTASALGSTMQ